MKKIRVIACLVVIAIMALNCVSYGEELIVDATDDMTLLNNLEVDMGQVDVDLGIDGQEIQNEALDIDLSDELPNTPVDAVADNVTSDGKNVIKYHCEGSYDNDALFAGYVEMLFTGKDLLGIQPNGWLGDRLTGVEGKIYDYLYQELYQIGIGKKSYTRFTIPDSIITNEEDLDKGISSFDTIVYSLLFDHPYTMFWCEWNEIFGNVDRDFLELEFCFPVVEEYAKDSYYRTDAAKIKSVDTAHQNAEKVVKLFADVPDYNKLVGYRDFICGAVEYNDDAVYDPDVSYGNPWQMIWVFDADPDTNVVSEGYAKAFQYLCNRTKFNGSIQSHIVEGIAEDEDENPVLGEDDYGHMWNLITMEDGKNYHVDIAVYDDTNYKGYFIAGATAQKKNLSKYDIDDTSYYFDDVIRALYPAKILKLSKSDYDPDWSKPKKISIKQGDTATLYMGNTLTLKTKLTPAKAVTKLKWSTDDKTVATVSSTGVVTPKKAGRARITVTTDNNLSDSIVVKVVDASSVKLMKGNKTLKKGTTLNLKRGKSLKLKATVSPAKVKTKLTWKSSNKYVTVKNGTVKVNAKAKVGSKARITVTTANGKSTYITILVN